MVNRDSRQQAVDMAVVEEGAKRGVPLEGVLNLQKAP